MGDERRLAGRAFDASEQGGPARQELLWVEGAGDVFVGSGIERSNAVGGVCEVRHDDDWRVGPDAEIVQHVRWGWCVTHVDDRPDVRAPDGPARVAGLVDEFDDVT